MRRKKETHSVLSFGAAIALSLLPNLNFFLVCFFLSTHFAGKREEQFVIQDHGRPKLVSSYYTEKIIRRGKEEGDLMPTTV